jgi:hypothetical protein
MKQPDLFKKRKKEKIERDSDLFEDLDVDIGSDHPVHEEFVDEKGMREVKKELKRKKVIRE